MIGEVSEEPLSREQPKPNEVQSTSIDRQKQATVPVIEQQIEQMQKLLHSILRQQKIHVVKKSKIKTKIFTLALIVGASYTAILWVLMQPIINPILFVPAFSIAIVCSLMLGKYLSLE